MKRLIREFEHLKDLFSELPPFLKRRVTMFDLEYLDRKLQHHIIGTPPTNDFDDFCNYVLGDLLHDFVVEKKDDEIDTVEDPHYGLIYSEDGLYELFEFVIPLLEANRDKYENDGFY